MIAGAEGAGGRAQKQMFFIANSHSPVPSDRFRKYVLQSQFSLRVPAYKNGGFCVTKAWNPIPK
jgi:hypothetical protein